MMWTATGAVEIDHLLARDNGWWEMAFHASDRETFLATVALLRQRVPSRHRQWLPNEHVWLLTPQALLAFADALSADIGRNLRKAYPELVATGGYPPTIHLALRALYLTSDAPLTLVKPVYRALAKQLHPDHGGDVAAMQRINTAYAELCRWQERMNER